MRNEGYIYHRAHVARYGHGPQIYRRYYELEHELLLYVKPLIMLSYHLYVVVYKADHAVAERHKYRDDYLHVAAENERHDNTGQYEHDAAHGGRALLRLVPIRAYFKYALTELKLL